MCTCFVLGAYLSHCDITDISWSHRFNWELVGWAFSYLISVTANHSDHMIWWLSKQVAVLCCCDLLKGRQEGVNEYRVAVVCVWYICLEIS